MGKGRGSGRSGDVDVNVKIETSEAFLLLLKSFLGSGTLSLPFAITHAGLMYGTTGFFILASFCINGIFLLVECSRAAKTKFGYAAATYPDLAGMLGGVKFRRLMSGMVVLTQLSVCCVSFAFVSENLTAIIPCESMLQLSVTANYLIRMTDQLMCFGGMDILNVKRLYILSILPLYILMSWTPDVRWLTPFSTLANVLIITVIFTMIFFAIKNMYWAGISDSVQQYPQSPTSLLAFFGNVIFVYEGCATVIPLTAAMKEQERAYSTMAAALATVVSLQATIMLLCYLSFTGIDSASIVAAVSRNKDLQIPSVQTTTANAMVTLAVMLSFPLNLFPAMQIIERWVGFEKDPNAGKTLTANPQGNPQGDESGKGFQPNARYHRTDTMSSEDQFRATADSASGDSEPNTAMRFSVTEKPESEAASSQRLMQMQQRQDSNRRRGFGAPVGGDGLADQDEDYDHDTDHDQDQAHSASGGNGEGKAKAKAKGKAKGKRKGKGKGKGGDGGGVADRGAAGRGRGWRTDLGGDDSEVVEGDEDEDGLVEGGAPIGGEGIAEDDDALDDGHASPSPSSSPTKKGKGGSVLAQCKPLNQLMFRSTIVVGISMVAAAVPNLGLIIELFGALCGCSLAILVPNALHLIVLSEMPEHEVNARGGRMIHEGLKAFRVMTVAVMFYLAIKSCMHTFEIMLFGEHEDDARKPMDQQ